ncbi:uncharacterized protein LOC132202477 [Neocloeon triangulifer]|uniref:uncharacterized protein LOC132202477 n=1 Tax=Neocloeon triangulifer TaxID=2078957 RepID=UPI00286F2DA0|nr:uncharacterized protein LOC132202477 [Neocloeon triangulifer]
MGRGAKHNPDDRFLVTHQGGVYDIAPFLAQHPGGLAHVEPYRGKSISHLLKSVRDAGESESSLVHSLSATYLLNQYRVGDDPKATDENKNHNGASNGAQIHQSTESIDDLEHLVDWSKPMLDQVASLGANYSKWVNLPVDKPLILFGNPILEKLTMAKWYYIPIFWIPIFFLFLKVHYAGGFSHGTTVFGLIFGVLLWTALEYSLHRWLFHMEPPSKSPRLITFHFVIHGLHHKVPFDGTRLVFPPAGSSILGIVLYFTFSALLPANILHSTAAGITLGYLFYDLFHYYLHFGAPDPSSHLYFMKRYHNQHHFSHHDSGYGITSPLWDAVFGTKIVLKKLAKAIRW